MYSKRSGIHSATLRSRLCARHCSVDGCSPDRQGNPCGLRLGRAHRQHHRDAVAGAGQSHGFGQRLSDRELRGQQEATAAGYRARLSRTTFLLIVARRVTTSTARLQQAYVDLQFAEVGLQRRHVRSNRGFLRQPRSRQHRDPQLPLAAEPSPGESSRGMPRAIMRSRQLGHSTYAD
jgi:hypothetical protein